MNDLKKIWHKLKKLKLLFPADYSAVVTPIIQDINIKLTIRYWWKLSAAPLLKPCLSWYVETMKLKKYGYRGSAPLLIGLAASIFLAGFLTYPKLIKNGSWSPKQAAIASPQSLSQNLDVCFTPSESCLPKVLKAIDGAKFSILLLGYSFTSKPITLALIKAKKRGIEVRIILDHSQKSQKYSLPVIEQLIRQKIDIRFDIDKTESK